VPGWLWAAVLVSIALGVTLGLQDAARPAGQRLARAVFLGGGLAYLAVSIVDFWEHYRLEKVVSGRYFGWTAVPLGESLNHAATTIVLVSMLVLGRPLRLPLEPRDWWVLMAPAVFLLLGWRDELVFHRRRAQHREDIMHTLAHLAAAVMLAGFAASRLVDWGPPRP
jgi:hypothetical protein